MLSYQQSLHDLVGLHPWSLPTASRVESANSCFAADGRPGHRDDRKKSILSQASTVRREKRRYQKTGKSRPNKDRTARREIAARGILPGSREESKAKREARGATSRPMALFCFLQSLQRFEDTIEFLVDLLYADFENASPRVDHQVAVPDCKRKTGAHQTLR